MESLQVLARQVERQRQLTVLEDSIFHQIMEVQDKIGRLKSEWYTEEADVERLKKTGLTAFFYEIIGKKEEKLEKEQQEALAAAARYQTAQTELHGLWRERYLSGNVREKLSIAKNYAENHPEYQVNVAHLEQVMPKDLEASDIEVRLGATWVDPKYIEDFMRETFQTPGYLFDRNVMGIQYSDVTGLWNVKGKNADYGNTLANMMLFSTLNDAPFFTLNSVITA